MDKVNVAITPKGTYEVIRNVSDDKVLVADEKGNFRKFLIGKVTIRVATEEDIAAVHAARVAHQEQENARLRTFNKNVNSMARAYTAGNIVGWAMGE